MCLKQHSVDHRLYQIYETHFCCSIAMIQFFWKIWFVWWTWGNWWALQTFKAHGNLFHKYFGCWNWSAFFSSILNYKLQHMIYIYGFFYLWYMTDIESSNIGMICVFYQITWSAKFSNCDNGDSNQTKEG